MDPRVREVIEILRAQVPNVQDDSRVANRNAQKPIENFSTEKLAQSVNLSETRLRALFKADTGMTPDQYLKKIRMERAREMAETTHLKITEILTILGLDSPSHFRRDFKGEYGLSLTECRRRRREDDK
ncbi:MAG: helix-turn-helix transcriptional regulator [Blastocatellia bacterium]